MTEVKKSRVRWWQIAATVVAFVASGAVARTCAQGAFDSGQRLLTPQSELEAQLDRYADTDTLMSTFSAAFPQEWATFRAATAADVKSSMSTDALKENSADRMRGFMTEHVAWTTSAPVPELNAVLSAERAFVDRLASEDPNLCARYGMAGLRGSETLSPAAVGLAMEIATAKIVATRRGRDHPQAYGEVTPEDVERLVAGMAQAGASDDVIDLMLGDASAGSPDQQCAGTRALFQSIDSMPDDQAARIYAMILREAAAEQRTQRP